MSAILKERILIYAAPVLLIFIAGIQIYLAHTQNLTAWKGGGFGMFSTVDSSGARFFRASLVTSSETFPIEIPQHLRRIARKARAIPTKKHLDHLAKALLEETWIPYEYDQFLASDLPQRQSPFKFLQDFFNQSGQPKEKEGSDTLRVVNNYFSDLQPRLRTKRDFEHPNQNVILPIEKVLLELWQVKFDSDSVVLSASKLLQTDKSNPVQ